MARYDGGWGRFPAGPRYDDPFRPYGPPGPVMRPGGSGRAGFDPVAGPVSPGYARDHGRGDPWGGVGAGGTGGGEEFWEPETVYGPARYGLGPYHERLRRQRRSDDELRDEVEEALFYDTWVDADAITVEVEDGIVTLRGELPDYDEIRYATDDAWDVDGVRGVRSDLTVRQAGTSSQPRGDTRAAGGNSDGGGRPGETAGVSAAPASPGGGGGAAAKRSRKKPSDT